MSDKDKLTRILAELDIEEVFITDWAEIGIEEIESYLAKVAAFQAYLAARDLDSDDGDGRASA